MQVDRLKRREFIALIGSATAWPLAARAQESEKRPTIGFLGADATGWRPWADAFVARLRELGWVEGRTIAIEYRWTEGRLERVIEIAVEFVRRKVVKGSVLLGSECCVATGDSGCEAYTAIAWGVGLSHERSDVAGAKSFYSLEGNMCGTAMRGADALPGSKDHITCKRIASEAGRSLASGRQRRVRGTVRIGKVRSRSR